MMTRASASSTSSRENGVPAAGTNSPLPLLLLLPPPPTANTITTTTTTTTTRTATKTTSKTTMMLGERCLQKWVNRLLYSPGARVFRRRVLLGVLFLLTLLVLMARLEAEDMRMLEANTLVLQAGFPTIAVDNASSSTLHLHHPHHHRLPHQHHNNNNDNNEDLTHLIQPHLPPSPHHGPTLTPTPLTLTPLQMAALAESQKHKWLDNHHYRPPLSSPHLREGEKGESRGERRGEGEERGEHSPPSCQSLIQGKELEQQRGKTFMDSHERVEKPPSEYIRETRNCSRFIQERGYIMAATEEEVRFPIAYSIMMYTGVEQAERMLRAIYRPHNVHCIHVDRKSPEELMEAMRGIASCLPNVFIASKLNKVYWATWSSLEALIFCMEDLWKVSKKWKYYINLTGQEFPLKTNLQLVRILNALNGSNIVDASTDPSRTWRWYNNFGPPYGIVPYKGMVFMMAVRGFVDFILHSPVSKDFLQWVRYTHMPDETYFPSLNHNPHLKVPGSYKGPPDTNAITKPYLARYVNWNTNWKDGDGRYNFRFPCFGMLVRDICIFGVRDLPYLTNRKELFVNKLYSTYQPLTFNCMEEWLINMTIAEYAGHIVFNTSFYASLDIVRNKVV